MDAALKRALDRAGSARALAQSLRITEQAISQWSRVPHLRVLDVERITGVPRQELRPDLYPPEANGSSAVA